MSALRPFSLATSLRALFSFASSSDLQVHFRCLANSPLLQCSNRDQRSRCHCTLQRLEMQRPTTDHSSSSLGIAPMPDEDAAADSSRLEETESVLLSSQIFKVHEDWYDGVIIDPDCLPLDVPTFVTQLHRSLTTWKQKSKRGVWLKLPTEKANLVPAAIEAGFKYHHAEPTYLMLTHWLADTPSTLPANASHQVGVGAFVVNEKQEVLAVQEKNGPLKGKGIWKMPTGLINQAEDIFAGAIREVKEETGVDTEFLELLGFRQGHHVAFDKSDLFFVCVLRPLSSEIVIQPSEIEAAQWMPMDEFAAQDFFQKRSMLRKIVDICKANWEGRYHGFAARAMESGFQKQETHFYYNITEKQRLYSGL